MLYTFESDYIFIMTLCQLSICIIFISNKILSSSYYVSALIVSSFSRYFFRQCFESCILNCFISTTNQVSISYQALNICSKLECGNNLIIQGYLVSDLDHKFLTGVFLLQYKSLICKKLFRKLKKKFLHCFKYYCHSKILFSNFQFKFCLLNLNSNSVNQTLIQMLI